MQHWIRLIGFRNMLSRYLVVVVLFLSQTVYLLASSHREAPLIANDPLADNTDLYAFRSPDDPGTITIIANYIPGELPFGGPNYYSFGENIRYEIHIDNNVETPGDDIVYRFTFHQIIEDSATFFNIRLGKQNLRTTYTLERSTDGGVTFDLLVSNGMVPPPNIGPRSIEGAAGLGAEGYHQLMQEAIRSTSYGERVFCGPIDDPFFVDLGGVFDLGDLPRQNASVRDGLAKYNVHTIALKIPIVILQKNGRSVIEAESILDPDFVIGVWASASRRAMRTLRTDGTKPDETGEWIQVSRLGMPLTNEAIIPVGYKDQWNSMSPYQDLTALETFGDFFYNPELSLYLDDDQFGGAVPAMRGLRIQSNSLQLGLDFRYGKDGLFPLKGSDAVAGTALDDAVFGTLLLPKAGAPDR